MRRMLISRSRKEARKEHRQEALLSILQSYSLMVPFHSPPSLYSHLHPEIRAVTEKRPEFNRSREVITEKLLTRRQSRAETAGREPSETRDNEQGKATTCSH